MLESSNTDAVIALKLRRVAHKMIMLQKYLIAEQCVRGRRRQSVMMWNFEGMFTLSSGSRD